jgi:hypothetical protein
MDFEKQKLLNSFARNIQFIDTKTVLLMSKKARDLKDIEIFKERFRNLDTTKIKKRLNEWQLQNTLRSP